MNTQIIVAIVAGILLVAAAIGMVYPLLPGSLLALVTLVVWAWIIDSWAAWTVAVIGSLLVVAGWSASAVLTGRKLKQQRSPRPPATPNKIGRRHGVGVPRKVAAQRLIHAGGHHTGTSSSSEWVPVAGFSAATAAEGLYVERLGWQTRHGIRFWGSSISPQQPRGMLSTAARASPSATLTSQVPASLARRFSAG